MSSLPRTAVAIAALLCISIITPATLFAQATGAEILGTVKDEGGGILPGVSITVTNLNTGITRAATTSEDGLYRTTDLPIGNYSVQGELQGFRTAVRQGIQLTVGRVAVVDLTLAIGAISENLVVVGDAPLVDVKTSSLGGLVGQQQIEDLPLNGRNFVQLALLETGVSAVRTASSSATFGTGLKMSVNGARMDYNNFMMDGTSMNSVNMTAVGGASGQALGSDAIQEFQVLTSNFSAEFGRSGGGVINVVTKSGANNVTGSASYFNRSDGMDSRNFFDTAADLPPFTRHQFGGTVGGPVFRNKTFFFGAYEGLRETLGMTFVGTVPTLAARQGILPTGQVEVDPRVRPYLDLYPVPNGRDFGDGRAEIVRTDTTRTEQNFAQLRIDHNISNSDILFVRYTRDFSDQRRPTTAGEVLFVDDVKNEFVTAEYKKIASPRLLNVFRVGYNLSGVDYIQQHLDRRFDDPSLWFVPNAIASGLQLSVSGLTALGGSVSIPRGRRDNVVQLTNALTFNPGRHAMRFGGEYQYILTTEEEIRQGRGAFTFTNLTNFLRAQPQSFTSASAESDFRRRWRQDLVATFFQDDIRATDTLTLNLGVRWEFVTNPSEKDGKAAHVNDPLVDGTNTVVGNPLITIPKANIAPRAGFAWAPGGSAKTAVRGGVGVFYPMMFRAYWAINRSLPPFVVNIDAEAPNISFPHPLEGGQIRQSVGGDSFQYDAAQPRVTQYNFTVQRELLPSTVATIGYVGSRGVNATHAINPNTAIPQILPDGRKFFPAGSVRRNPNWGEYRYKVTDSSSEYHALQLKLIHRVRDKLQLQGSYTWSRSMDDSSEFGTGGLSNQQVPQDPFDLESEWGYSAFDVRHLASINVSYQLPGPTGEGVASKLLKGWQLTGIATFSGGLPFSVTNSFDRDRDGDSGNSRPNLVPGRDSNPVLGGPVQYFDPSAFVLQEAGFYGDLGRNTVIGPGVATVDMAVVKNTSVGGGRFNIQVRGEVFNLLNRANFSLPVQTVFRSANGVPAADAGRITSTSTSARQAQIGLRLTF